MKRFPVGELRLDEKTLRDNLGSGRVIFVGSSCDMWADAVQSVWIEIVLGKIRMSPHNQYLFQSKNPARFKQFRFPGGTLLGTTLETNRPYDYSQAPSIAERARAMSSVWPWPYEKMISVEPVMDFDLDEFAGWIQHIGPKFVSIGADSKGHGLPEPPKWKLEALIEKLQCFTEVKLKSNLKRLGITIKERADER